MKHWLFAAMLLLSCGFRLQAEESEWLALRGGRSLVFRTVPLTTRNAAITSAVVMIHGGAAGAEGHFRIAVDAVRQAGTLAATAVVAPRIPSNDAYVCVDALADGEINWGCQANNGWPAGGTSSHDATLTSYDVVDALLRRLADRKIFPNLRSIVVAGHSAGGQFVTRYAMANQVDETLGVAVRYVVANPAHYAYPDEGRPGDATACPIADVWPYGLRDRVGYAARVPDARLRAQLASRPVTYLLGDQDTLTGGGLDTTCAAMAQGPNRFARGQAFARYVNEKYKAGHDVVVVPGCGHDPGCMFTAAAGVSALTRRAAR